METAMEAVAVNETSAATPASNNVRKLDKGDFVIVQEDFSRGITKGLGFCYKEYKTLDGAVKHLDSLNKQADLNGELIVLGLLNNAIKGNLRSRANSKVPDGKDDNGNVNEPQRRALIAGLIASGANILVDEVTAENYVPGTREKTSIPSLLKEYNELKEEAIEAKKAGDMESFEDYKNQAKEVYARVQALLAAEQNLDTL